MQPSARLHRRLLDHRRTYITLRRLAMVQRQVIRQPHEDDFRLFATMPSDGLFLDIGANTGTSALAFRLYKRRSPILSIEPNPLNEPELRFVRRFLRRFDYLLTAAGAHHDTLTLHTPSYNGIAFTPEASLSRPHVEARLPTLRQQFGLNDRPIDILQMTVPVKPLDDLRLAPAFIKIDVQGWEIPVLQGLAETLVAHHPLLLIETGPEIRAVGNLLASHGYAPHTWEEGRLAPNDEYRGLNIAFLPT